MSLSSSPLYSGCAMVRRSLLRWPAEHPTASGHRRSVQAGHPTQERLAEALFSSVHALDCLLMLILDHS